MKISLNKAEYQAVNALRGLPDGAHMMVMTSSFTSTGGELEGDEMDFDELVDFVSEELAYGMASGSQAAALVSMCEKIQPGCSDWLGE